MKPVCVRRLDSQENFVGLLLDTTTDYSIIAHPEHGVRTYSFLHSLMPATMAFVPSTAIEFAQAWLRDKANKLEDQIRTLQDVLNQRKPVKITLFRESDQVSWDSLLDRAKGLINTSTLFKHQHVEIKSGETCLGYIEVDQ